tara:strand:+ start:873 stop:1331 length:459 start_codon:yes stop_codon:yes gene_type:complete
MWWDIIKEIKVLSEAEVAEIVVEFKTAVEKGYPSVVTPLNLVAEVNDEGKIEGFTSYKDMGDFFFVGNAFIYEIGKGKGLFSDLRKERDGYTSGKPRITLLNPLDAKSAAKVEAIASKSGDKVTEYSQVEDIMDEGTYKKMATLPMYRYPVI